MRYFTLLCAIFLTISCTTSSQSEDLEINISNFEYNNSLGDISKIEVRIVQNDIEKFYTFRNNENLYINDIEAGSYVIEITLATQSGLISSNTSAGFVENDSANTIFVDVVDASVKYIILIDTNPSTNVNVSQFYNYSIDGKYYKRYDLANAEQIADAYIAAPMLSFYQHNICGNLDENMVAIVFHDSNVHYNPVTISQTAMRFYSDFIETGQQESLTGFINNADWLLKNRDDCGYLQYTFEWTHCGNNLTDNWISAMAQGEALGVMCMAYHQTGDEKYLAAASDFFSTLKSNKSDYWCVGIDSTDYLWFEEYPSEDFCHVLNGKLFALWGIWNYYAVTRNEQALEMFEGGLKSVLDHYPTWNNSGEPNTKYCWHDLIMARYDIVHRKQIIAYRDFFGIEEFDDMLISFFEYNE